MELDRERMAAAIVEKRRLSAEESRRIVTARNELEAILAKRTNQPAPGSAVSAPATNNSPPPQLKPAAVAPNSELRQLQVQAHVSDQRLRFGALLDRLGFTSEQRQAFDRIQGAFQQAMVDEAQTATNRQAAPRMRDAQLKELFGANYEQWMNANRNGPARSVVNQIVQNTFQSSGALTTAQADELTQIVAQHRLPAERESASQQRYDWDRIITDAQAILAERQRQDFVTAIEFRRASDRMSMMAAKKN